MPVSSRVPSPHALATPLQVPLLYLTPFSVCRLGVAYQPRGKLAGVQLCPRQRGTLYMHSGGTPTDDVLT